MTAVKTIYGEKILVQSEDFANHNAFELLSKYSSSHLVFNDDIQGTTSVVLAGLIAFLKLIGGTLADHTFLFLGAGEAVTGIAELIALEISKKTQAPIEETLKKIWLVDSKVASWGAYLLKRNVLAMSFAPKDNLFILHYRSDESYLVSHVKGKIPEFKSLQRTLDK